MPFTKPYKIVSKKITQESNLILEAPITKRELQDIIDNLAKDKAPGADTLTAEILQILDNKNIKTTKKALNTIKISKTLPHSWKQIKIWTVYKKEDPTELKNYRPISLCQILYKVYTRIITKRLETILETNEILSPTQAGSKKRHNTQENTLTINNHSLIKQSNNKPTTYLGAQIQMTSKHQNPTEAINKFKKKEQPRALSSTGT